MLTDYNSKEPDDNFRSVSRKRKRLNCSRRSGKFQLIDIVQNDLGRVQFVLGWYESFWTGSNLSTYLIPTLKALASELLIQIRLLWTICYNWTRRK